MKRFLLAFALAVLVAGCSKSQDTNTATTDQSTSATAASDAVASPAATDSAATTATDTPSVAGATASGAPFVAIDLPLYPGMTKEPDKSMEMQSNGASVKVDTYSSKDDSATVAAWYKAHLPSTWANFTISSGAKTAATFSSPDHGNDGQSVIVSGEDAGGTHIQLSTKTGP
jgi:uncharacterized lipoprotein